MSLGRRSFFAVLLVLPPAAPIHVPVSLSRALVAHFYASLQNILYPMCIIAACRGRNAAEHRYISTTKSPQQVMGTLVKHRPRGAIEPALTRPKSTTWPSCPAWTKSSRPRVSALFLNPFFLTQPPAVFLSYSIAEGIVQVSSSLYSLSTATFIGRR